MAKITQLPSLDQPTGNELVVVADPADNNKTKGIEVGRLASAAAAPAVARAEAAALAANNSAGTVIRANLISLEEGIAAPQVMTYASTPGRWRLGSAGFVVCASNEERLCYDTSGQFLGTMIQPAGTYYSAPWHVSDAPHTATDPAYLTKTSGTGTSAYAGAHAEPDIFGTVGKGVLLTQGATPAQYFSAINNKFTSAIGDVVRVHAIVAVTPTSVGAGSISLRTVGGISASVPFPYDASGLITGYTENWGSYRIGSFDIGVINGKRWAYIWFDALATSAAATYAALGFATADPGMKIHFCELMIQQNPQQAPAAVPVCAANKIFAADTINTGVTQNVGYVMPYLAVARSQAPLGKITAPAITVGLPYLPIEKEIRVLHSTETTDRAGILHNENEAYYFTPWKTPADFVIGLGPSSFPNAFTVALNKGCVNYALQPVFVNRPELAPYVKKLMGETLRITGTLRADGCIFLGMADAATSYWQQTDVRSDTTAQQYLAAGVNIYARNALVMGCPVTHTRARGQVQDDDTDDGRVYVGEFCLTVGAGAVDVSGTRFHRMGRGPFVAGSAAASAVSLNVDDTYYDLMWSDGIYPTKGTFTATGNRRFHGRFTAKEAAFWQSRKELEVDLLDGAGWRAFSASGLTESQLPNGKRATSYGTYNFDTAVLTEDPDDNLTMMVRHWGRSGTAVGDKPGYQFHADQVENTSGKYRAYPTLGSVWVISTSTMRVRIYVDGGKYSNSTGLWTADTSGNPAQSATGTHADNFQVNTANVGGWSLTADQVFLCNNGQGPYMMGASAAAINSLTMTKHIVVTSEFNATLIGNGTSSTACTINLDNWLLAQREVSFRLLGGTAEETRLFVNGALTTLNIGSRVWVATPSEAGLSLSGSPVVNGAVKMIPAPKISNYNQLAAVARPYLANLLRGDLLDPTYRTVKATADPRDVATGWTPYAEAKTGIALNAIGKACIGNHPRWDGVIATDIVRVYFKAPDVTLTIPAGTAVGTAYSLNGKVKASSFHVTRGNHRRGYFGLDGKGNLVVLKALTGLDTVRLLRTAFDETILIDITA